MDDIKIRRTRGDYISLDLSDPQIAAHVSSKTSQARLIAAQLDTVFYPFFNDKSDLVVLDLGANIGLFSMHVSDCCSKIFAIEPTPSHFSILQKNIKNLPRITPLRYAVSPTNGPIEFFIDESNSTMNSLVKRTSTSHTTSVEGMTLRAIVSIINQKKIDFCKIDIEGSEYESITASSVGEVKDVVRNFFIETHETHGRSFDFMAKHFLDIFTDAGYSATRTGIDAIFATRINQKNLNSCSSLGKASSC